MKNILSKYRKISQNTSLNVAQNIIIDGVDTNIPRNVPTFIVGSKNAGKSTVISALISAEKINNTYTRIIYIYTDHVDSTLAETCHEQLIRVPLNQSINFITDFFKIKAEYFSWIHFLRHNIESGILNEDFRLNNPDTDISLMLRVYTDNVIDAFVRNTLNINKSKSPVSVNIYNQYNPVFTPNENPENLNRKGQNASPTTRIINYAITFINKYSKPFDINCDGSSYYIDGLQDGQYDQLIIDDVGVAAPYLFPTSVNKSPLYRFLTISRHILLGVVIAGQDLMQLPKYARKEINTYLFGVGLDIETIKNTSIPKNKQKEIMNMYNTLKQYDFIQYNDVNKTINYLPFSSEHV